MRTIVEPAKEVPVMCDVDVAVVGSGVSGAFAAIAAGRLGARTLVVDRFGSLGGNLGPGLIVGGGGNLDIDNPVHTSALPGGHAGIAREFVERLKALRLEPNRYPEVSSLSSWVAADMMREAGVEVLLSAYAADPILEGQLVRGLFVETKAGRVAVQAAVTVDATGEADLARRAGESISHYLEPTESHKGKIRAAYMNEKHPTYYNESGILFLIAGVDWDRYQTFGRQEVLLTEEEAEWLENTRGAKYLGAHLAPMFCRAEKRGEFSLLAPVPPNAEILLSKKDMDCGNGIVAFRASSKGHLNASDPRTVSLLETSLRDYAQRVVFLFRESIPGFEAAYLLGCSSFLGWRGGPRIEGAHTLTVEEMWSGQKFDDVLYRCICETKRGGDPSGYDVPYRMALPKTLDGLLVCGRGAAYERRGHDPSIRARPSMMVFGQCVGTAAAIAALDGAIPRKVEVKKVQKKLLADGVFLGEESRLRELGLV